MIAVYIILAVLVLLLMITIHEAGHYTAGRLLGFGITEFSVGLGPRLFSHKRRSGEIVSVRALPLGGFCAFYGEDDAGSAKADRDDGSCRDAECPDEAAENDGIPPCEKTARDNASDAESEADEKSGTRAVRAKVPFDRQPPWKRIIVLLAGPLFNLLSAFVFSFVYILAVGYSVPVVTELAENPDTGMPYASELREGDVIVAVNGREITFLDTAAELMAQIEPGETAVFTVERDGVRVNADVAKSAEENGGMYGITAVYESRGVDVLHAVGYSFPYTFELSWLVLKSFGMLFTGGVPITDVTGPIGTVATIATYSQTDMRYFLFFLPLIASNLAIFNLLPVPALDGARIVFAVIEQIRRKPVNKKTEGTIHAVGLIVLLAFVIIVDIVGMIARGVT